MPTLLTLNTTVPGVKCAGSPILIYYDNGDWEITFAKGLSFVERSSNYVSYTHVADIFNEINAFFGLDSEDTSDEEVLLFFSETIEEGHAEEPVLVLFDDKDADLLPMARSEAQASIESSNEAINFIALPDFFEDVRRFITLNSAEMFADDGAFEPEDDDGDHVEDSE